MSQIDHEKMTKEQLNYTIMRNVMRKLGTMFDYGIRIMQLESYEFIRVLIYCHLDDLINQYDPNVWLDKTAIEILRDSVRKYFDGKNDWICDYPYDTEFTFNFLDGDDINYWVGRSIGYWFSVQLKNGEPLTFREIFTWIDYSEFRLHYRELSGADDHHFSDVYSDLLKEREKAGDYGYVFDLSNCLLGKRVKPVLDFDF